MDPYSDSKTYRDEKPVPKPRERFALKPNERSTSKPNERQTPKQRTMPNASHVFKAQEIKYHCPLCKEPHPLKSCVKFAKMSYMDRKETMRSLNLCNNCFKPGHIALGCLASMSCEVQGCRRHHHTLLHPPNRDGSFNKPKESETKATSSTVQVNSLNTVDKIDEKICLRIVPVKVQGPHKSVITYALLDNGSDVSLCDKELS